MKASACGNTEALLGVPRERLSEAERLLLEDHLVECEICREHNGLVRVVAEIGGDFPEPLREAARVRAISGAIRVVRQEREREQRLAPARRWLTLGVAAAAAAAGVVGLLSWDSLSDEARSPGAAVAKPAAAIAVVEEPAVVVPAAEAEERVVESDVGANLRFAHAQLALAARTRVRLLPATDTVVLEQGRASFDVDPTEKRPFHVQTSRFRVDVLGTRFVVTEQSVSVQAGHVAVFAPDGTQLARDLGAGATFSVESARRAAEPKARVSAARLLAAARDALAGGDANKARELVVRAEEENPHRADRAEAGTLRAEIALVERDPAIAVRAYLSVAERFADLPAGENAQFAAAQLLRRQGDEAAARAAFSRYVEHYPQGRFANEARKRLR